MLDNFEHLNDAADFLDNIVEFAPGVDLLVTSREVLNLREEWLYPVLGMPFPLDAHDSRLETYDAVQLFVEHAQRVRREFALHADRVHVVRLCQIVEGMPLALNRRHHG
ncbi:MAG: hypothetical protein IPK19_27345 [Chloroflexi bacterium]|nr:hypothetical protein [Chloroflexota bacterium]